MTLSELHAHVLAFLRRHRMLVAGDRVGVAVSGGADSVALLLLLADLRETLGITLVVLHFHHQLRGSDADADERFAAELAATHGLSFLSDRADVAAEAVRHRWNLEDAARRLRYRFFDHAVASGQVTRVAVAHTADDQAETVLAHLLRGTGPTGLAGIYPVAGRIVRPLLGTRRDALREFLRARGQAWREDETNRDLTRLRARIRHTLLPQLETQFQPTVVERLASLAALAREEEEFWRWYFAGLLRASRKEEKAPFKISIHTLLRPVSNPMGLEAPGGESPAAPAKRFIRSILEGVMGRRHRVSSEHVDKVIWLALEGSGGQQVHLPGGVVVQRTLGDELTFAQRAGETVPAAQPYEYVVDLPRSGERRVEVSQIGKRFCLKVIDWPPAASDTREGGDALDLQRLCPPVCLRNWRPGDAYRPHGHREIRKLKRLFWEQGIDALQRPAWPVLTSAGRLAWACGFPAAEEFAASEGTRSALLIIEEPL